MVINNKKEFEEIYPYDKNYIQEYPIEYPCVVKIEHEDCGLFGDYKRLYVAYFPNTKKIKQAFIDGLNYKWKPLK
jgi:hypothetical protein